MKFMKVFLAALLAVVAGSFLTALIWIMVLVGIAGSMESGVGVEENSILKIDMAENITDSPCEPLLRVEFSFAGDDQKSVALPGATGLGRRPRG